MNREMKFLKLKSKSIILHVIIILLMLLILPVGIKMLLNNFQNQELTDGIRKVYTEGMKSGFSIFVVVETIDFALGLRLYILSGLTRKKIFNMTLIFILGISLLYALLVGILGQVGFDLNTSGFAFESIARGKGIMFFVDYFIQFITIAAVVNCITLAFKSNYKTGIATLVLFGIIYYIYWIIFSKTLTITNIIVSIISCILGLVGSKVILKHI